MATNKAFPPVPGPIDVETDYSRRLTHQWPFQDLAQGITDSLNDSVARIESLKIRVLAWPGVDSNARNQFFAELDLLRDAFLRLARFSSEPDHAQRQQAPESSNLHTPLEELRFEGIVGQSPRIANILRIISRVAKSRLTVLLEGETGTGKELFARIIHNNSDREGFLAVNCGAFPSGLIESELFGHVRGAFTGATHERKGAFEEAQGGTIFLDEIGELEPSAQVKLLRVLESGELQRVGSDRSIETDVRVIAATNKDLTQMVEDGTFREDLYYRLNVCPVYIPPLRERRDEVPVLFDYFFRQLRQRNPVMSKELREFIYFQYNFPGNIRELRNLAQYIAMMDVGNPVQIGDLPESYQRSVREMNTPASDLDESSSPLTEVRDQAEKAWLTELARRHRGNVSKIAKEIRLSRSRAYQLFQKHSIDPAQFR